MTLIFGFIGGIGLFLFGMQLLSNGLKQLGRERTRRLLELLTKTPLIGVMLGAATTVFLQSSSATTVTVVGLVNAGLLPLKQAISVVMGCNIGTTFTAWLVSFLAVFKITDYALPVIGLGFFLNVLAKTRKSKYWGETLLGFGLLFLGLGIMKDVFAPLKDSEFTKQCFTRFSFNPLLGILVGTIFTMLLQSSSATVAVIQLLAFQGVISFESAIPLVLGDNIGTTITAQIAAFNTTRVARRTAMAHTVFNVLGVLWLLPFVWTGIYARAIDAIMPGPIRQTNIMLYIAISHSAFNIINTIVFLPMLGLLEKLTIWLAPARKGETEVGPKYLEEHLLDTPGLALTQARKEAVRMAGLAREAVKDALEGFFSKDLKRIGSVPLKEDIVDNLQIEVSQYLSKLTQKTLSVDESETLPVLLHSVNDIERIADHAQNLVELAERMFLEKLAFSEQASEELKRMANELYLMMDYTIRALETSSSSEAKNALKKEHVLNRMQIELRESHVHRLNNGVCAPLAGIIFIDFVDNIEKIGDHLTNIAQAVTYRFRYQTTKG